MRAVAASVVVLLGILVACSGSSSNGGGGGADGGAGGSGGAGGGTAGTDCAEEPQGTPAPWGLDERPANPTCVAPPRPRAAASVELRRVFPALRFERPLWLLQAPGDDDSWYVVEKGGRVYTFSASDPSGTELFADLRSRVASDPDEGGLLGMAFHPAWPTRREVFLSFTSSRGGFHSVIARYRTDASGSRLDPGSEQVVLTVDQPRDYHNGGHILFGPDGLLYVGMGDGGQGMYAPRPNLLLGKMLRIDPDGGTPYAVPPDNPFLGTDMRPEVWATGFRNPWRWSFDRATGEMWLGDVGQVMFEEINRVEAGGNYGWNVREGPACHKDPNCSSEGLIDPVYAYGRDQGQSVTGGYVYRGAALPALAGAYVFGDFVAGRVWGLFRDGASDEPTVRLLTESGLNIASFAQGNDGELYALNHFGGGIYQLVDTGDAVPFPARLSETGCFDPTDPTIPAPGLVPYDVNAPLWSDGARKDRWLAVPDGTTIAVNEEGDWELPIGTVLVKHFYLGCRQIETRLFVRHDDGDWAGYTYAWNEAGTDADLLPDRLDTVIHGKPWSYPSRAECMQCHTAAAGRVLGLETAQLDREIVWPGGRRSNVLDTFVHVGLLESMPDRSAGPLPAFSGNAHVEARARSYLHANCASCHRPGGTGQGTADYRYVAALEEMGICDEPPQGDDLGLEEARLLAPGEPDHSLLYLRMKALGAQRMPPIASAVVDEEGLGVVEAWIRWLDRCP